MLTTRYRAGMKPPVRWLAHGLAILSLTLQSNPCAGQDAQGMYKASGIPPGLLHEVDAVFRADSLAFTVDGTQTTITCKRVVTVLNAAGRHYGTLRIYYNKFRTIEYIRGRLLDAAGREIRTLDDPDIVDESAISGYSLYDDSRVQNVSMYHSQYPYTVVLEYELENDGAINWPEWTPEYRRASVERARFEVHLTDTSALRWWKDTDIEPQIARREGETVYIWTANHLQPLDVEPIGPPAADQYFSVKTAPAQFEMEGYRGDLTSWSSFGLWFHRLYENRQTLSPRTVAEVSTITTGLSSSREKVRRLYEYLQSKTRYVNVSLGIGGWQPYDAAYVEERGYGDCKALTNYMHSLLKAANIESFPALIYAGEVPRWLVKEFPHNCFNHVILCVPVTPDTVWLECTSQTSPFAHLSASIENRYVLLVTEKGGILARTPASKPTDNCQIRTATVLLESTGNGSAEIRTLYTGNQQDRVRGALATATPREREEWLREDIDIPAYTLRSADFLEVGNRELQVALTFKVNLRQYASSAGRRLLLPPNLMEKRSYVPPADTARRQPIMHSYPYLDIDSIRYTLPAGFTVEALPKPVKLETSFGRYAASVAAIGEGELLYTRHLEITATELPAAMYDAYREFWTEVVKADKAVAAIGRK